MEDPIDQVLRHLIATCPSPAELTMRVKRTLGDQLVPQALQMASEIRGKEWLGQYLEVHEGNLFIKNLPRQTRGMQLTRKQQIIAIAGTMILALLLLFPPHYMPLSQELVTNLGFAGLFTPPQRGELFALVNVPLLVTLMAGTVLVTIAATYIAGTLKRDA